MKLHHNKTVFKDAVTITAQRLHIPAIYVEKDYWVTVALHTIFTNAIGKETVFKGGTALSKCFSTIQRFSEDIDLVVIRRAGESNSKLNTKIKEIGTVVEQVLPEIELPTVTHKMGMNRKTAHRYGKEFQGIFGQVREVIIVEATWLGHFEPYTTQKISSLIYAMLEETGQTHLAEEYGLLPFPVHVLSPTRTFCEKIMSLVRFSYTQTPIEDLKKKIRHTYDLHQLLLDPAIQAFFASPAFDTQLQKVGQDDLVSFKNNNVWLYHHPKDALIFAQTNTVWNQLKSTYTSSFKELVFGALPPEHQISETLQQIAKRLNTVQWNIH